MPSTKPKEEMADLEVPEPNNQKVACPACQAINEPGAKACLVCGAEFEVLAGTATNTALEQDLGRANLLRLRGSYKEASELCLAILRKAPNNVTAHSLLGDIYYDQDDLRQAAEWYELASDLDPTAVREKQLLDRIRERVNQRDQAQTLAQLGVETTAPAINRYLFGGIIGIIAFGVIGYLIGSAVQNNREPKTTVSNPIVIPPNDVREPESPPVGTMVPSPPLTEVRPDRLALDEVKRGTTADLILSAVELPDRSQLIVTANARTEENFAVTALLVAADIFVNRTSTRSATIRLVENSEIVFIGEITRDAYDEAQALSGGDDVDLQMIAAQAFPSAWINEATSNVRPRSDQGATGSSESAPGQSTGSLPESP